MLPFSFFTALLATYFANSLADVSPREGQVIASCLERVGGMTYENAERLQRYKQWADNYEEFPCFTNCYLNKLSTLYKENAGFNETAVIEQFGKEVHKVCERRLSEGRDACDIAYNGFHCLVTMLDDPFVHIDRLPNITTEARTVMKDCLRPYDRSLHNRIKDYSKLPTREPIRCYTKCIVDNLQLLNPINRHWNIASLRHHLNIRFEKGSMKHCHALTPHRKRNACAWVYRELTCFMQTKPK
uniref:Odorant binding protein n=1 Tax=Liriomyza trifolii TaxID=198433 RepID=A0A2Z4SWV2_LIRTR|nr:odorant binding protein [Liriomyza trifolii]